MNRLLAAIEPAFPAGANTAKDRCPPSGTSRSCGRGRAWRSWILSDLETLLETGATLES